MPVKVQYFPTNNHGRDLVVGDIHGQRSILDRLLDSIDFNPKFDRIFATGDFVDRGQNSYQCAKLCGETWFNSVMGNHEATCIEIAKDIHSAELRDIARNMGAEWLYEPGALDVVDAFHELPHIIVVGSGEKRFNIVHADLLQAGLDSDDLIDQANSFEASDLEQDLLWSSSAFDRMMEKDQVFQPHHLSPTFCGHITVPQVCTWGSYIFLDTGCGLEKKPLSGVIIQEGKIITAKPTTTAVTAKKFNLRV